MFYHDEGDGPYLDQDEVYDDEVILETWHPFDLEGAEIIDVEVEPAGPPAHLYDFDIDAVAASAAARPERRVTRRRSPRPGPFPEDPYAYDAPGRETGEWSPERTARVMSGGLELAALAFLLFLAAAVLLDRRGTPAAVASSGNAPSTVPLPVVTATRPPPTPLPSPAVIAPYAPGTYWVTQGHHGTSYGHLAIDISAGKGAPVLSPIDGEVTGNYVDVWGNTTLVIENRRFRVTMLHGDYTVGAGDSVVQGQVVGAESNRGYTKDMQGRSCRNRDCGYHTHLNIEDRATGQNADPFLLLGIRR